MKKAFLGASVLTFAASAAFAGGIDRSGQGVNILFEEGDFAQFSFAAISPSVSGDGVFGPLDDVAKHYNTPSLGYKHSVNENIDIAFIYDHPFGAHVYYPTIGGSGADISSEAYTGILRYKFDNGVSVYAGARAAKVGGNILSTPGYLEADSNHGFGGLVGVSYEKPEIAMRVALTYNTGITTDFEGFYVDPTASVHARAFDVEFPESVNLDFQTGIAKDTLIFGTVRWVGWDGFNLTTEDGIEWVSFDDDTVTYSVGIGRQINSKLSLALSAGYEKASSKETTTLLAPTAGSSSIGIAATYQINESLSISGGLNYIWLGDTYFGAPGFVDFKDNTAIGAGVRIGMRF
ncbi:long-subunit fatty acid transport protein [Shimia isoporae]|uniref:Long-subunit fatty acid transport protein n=1 Tax=Shimia isoporae TaxID=647720 RepID=A0A4R1NRE1_9RHOB|nr:hypothetical protein [Shimia isoporae]TCL09303.1 long-subunit fatty acid transport protein [Shimia isoporae]